MLLPIPLEEISCKNGIVLTNEKTRFWELSQSGNFAVLHML